MIVPMSGFCKGDPGLELDVERMANGNMADGKCVPASKDGVETKAPEKTGALHDAGARFVRASIVAKPFASLPARRLINRGSRRQGCQRSREAD